MKFSSQIFAGLMFWCLGHSANAMFLEPEMKPSLYERDKITYSQPCPTKLEPPAPVIKDLAMLERLWRGSTSITKELVALDAKNLGQRKSHWFGNGKITITGLDDAASIVDMLYAQIHAAEQRAHDALTNLDQIETIVDIASAWFSTAAQVEDARHLEAQQVAAIFGLRTMRSHPIVAPLWQ